VEKRRYVAEEEAVFCRTRGPQSCTGPLITQVRPGNAGRSWGDNIPIPARSGRGTFFFVFPSNPEIIEDMQEHTLIRGTVHEMISRYREGTIVSVRGDTGEEWRCWIPSWKITVGDRIEGGFLKGRNFYYPVDENAVRVYQGNASSMERELGQAVLNAVPTFGYQRALQLAKRPDALDYLTLRKDPSPLFTITEHRIKEDTLKALGGWRWYFLALEKLLNMGLTPLEAASALEALGEPAVGMAQKDIFLLCQVPGIDYLTLAARLQRTSPVGALLQEIKGLLYASGDTVVHLSEIPLPPATLEAGLEGAAEALEVIDPWVGFRTTLEIEKFILENIKERSGLPPLPPLEGLNERQALARDLLAHRLAVLTGGPGTGKTYTLGKVVQAAVRAGIQVSLMAPTGKAAQRMQSLAAFPASTIHRALGFRPNEPFASIRPLPRGLVVLDEASMVTLADMERVLLALPPGSCLLLVGDTNQLAPVGIGQPFADLVDRIATVRLEAVQRQSQEAQGILSAARATLEGHPWREIVRQSPHDLLFRRTRSPREAVEIMLGLITHYLGRGLSLWDIQVLTPVHKGPMGTKELNTAIRSLVRPHHEKGRRLELSGGVLAGVGDKIIFDENRPTIGVVNGTIGIIKEIGDSSFLLETAEELKELPNAVASQATLGYAITVHRSQGSEWPVVILMLPESPLTTRKVVYTAITRGKEQVAVITTVDLEHQPLAEDRRRRTYLSLAEP